MKKQFPVSFEIYSENAISDAIKDFSEVADITLLDRTIQIEGNSQEEIQEVFLELMNYVLSI